MKTMPISNKLHFSGYVNVSGLNEKQEEVYDSIRNTLNSKVSKERHLILNISGTSNLNRIENNGKEAKYIIMQTQVKAKTAPTAVLHTDSLKFNDWLDMVNEIIKKHKKSDLYKETTQLKLIKIIKKYFSKIKQKI